MDVQTSLNLPAEPLAQLKGEAVTELPKDLYIPPDAMAVVLELFEGPLDLLLYLIKKHQLDILNIPIVQITKQYLHYIELMQQLEIELAGEYLLMAAMLAEIKSRVLLPKPPSETEEAEDPRAELVRRLQEYEQFKKASFNIETLSWEGVDTFTASADFVLPTGETSLPPLTVESLLKALGTVLKRAEETAHHAVSREPLSVKDRIGTILERVSNGQFLSFFDCFVPEEGRQGVVVSFLALLELLKTGAIEVVQAQDYGDIHIKGADSHGNA